ncbi:MAG TPA: hydrogenase maturation protease [Burkholderiales bacterium]
MSAARILVFAWGNPSRGDDALGPEFLARIEALAGTGVEFLTDFQLQPEHAADLHGRALVLFVDASVSCFAPYDFQRVEAGRDASFTSHAMSPGAVLAAYRDAFGVEPPPAFLLAIRGERFELGEDLGAVARDHLEAALEFAALLLSERTPEAWDRHVLHCG